MGWLALTTALCLVGVLLSRLEVTSFEHRL